MLEKLLSSRAKRRTPSPIRELVPLMGLDGMISLGGGYPNPQTFAFTGVRLDTCDGEAIDISGADLLAATQYGPTDGLPELLDLLRQWQRHKDGVDLSAVGLITLNGSQEGLYMVADALLDPGDAVVVSEPTYPGALAAFRTFTDHFIAVPIDAEGERADVLEALLTARADSGQPMPKFIYTIPSGHNPAGITTSEARRRHLVAIAQRFGVLIVDDDPYQLVQLEPQAPRLPTLQALAPDQVLRLDSFSKILCPGLRLGYASGPAALVRAMSLYKQAANLHTSSMGQVILAAYLRQVGFDGLLARIEENMRLYRSHRDAMVAAAREHLPPEVRFHVPTAGMFIWFELPPQVDADHMVRRYAQENKVLLVPGPAFSTQGGCRHAVRASFSMVGPAQLAEGMRRLAQMIARCTP